MYAGTGMVTPDEVRRLAAAAQWTSQKRRWRQQQLDTASHAHILRISPASSPSHSPASPHSPHIASQLSSLRRLSASTASLSRKPADSLKRQQPRHRLPTSVSSEEELSEESEFQLSDDSALSSDKSDSSGGGGGSDDEESKSPLSSDASERRRTLHNARQARYAARRRSTTQRTTTVKVEPSSHSVVTKRRLSSSQHISPGMLPVVKAQMVQTVLATVIKQQQHPTPHPQHSPHNQQLLLMSPLTLDSPASSLSPLSTHSACDVFASSTTRCKPPVDPFLNMSVDVMYVILSFLHPIELLSLSAVSTAAHHSTSDPSIWHPLVHQPWPITCDHAHDWKRVYCTRIKRALAGAQYICTFCACTRTFKTQEMYEAHFATHTQHTTVYPCTVAGCGLSFATHRKLAYHEKRHAALGGGTVTLGGAKQFACDWPGCELRYATPYALRLHKCRHTGAKRPHACKHDGCDASFNSRHALALHVDTHNARSERKLSFTCRVEGCGRSYTTKSGLSKHSAKVHGGGGKEGERVKRYVCGVSGCERGFHFESELVRHERKKHKSKVKGEVGVKPEVALAEEQEEEHEVSELAQAIEEGRSDPSAAPVLPLKAAKRRAVKRVVSACVQCRHDKSGCDGQRPCKRCTKKGWASKCIDRPAEERERTRKGRRGKRKAKPADSTSHTAHNNNADNTGDEQESGGG